MEKTDDNFAPPNPLEQCLSLDRQRQEADGRIADDTAKLIARQRVESARVIAERLKNPLAIRTLLHVSGARHT